MKLARFITSAALAVTMIGFFSPAASADPTGARNYYTGLVTCDTLGTVTLQYTSSPTTLSSAVKVLGTGLTLILRSVRITKTAADGTVVSDDVTLSKSGSPVINEYCWLSFPENGLTVTITDGFLLRGPGAE